MSILAKTDQPSQEQSKNQATTTVGDGSLQQSSLNLDSLSKEAAQKAQADQPGDSLSAPQSTISEMAERIHSYLAGFRAEKGGLIELSFHVPPDKIKELNEAFFEKYKISLESRLKEEWDVARPTKEMVKAFERLCGFDPNYLARVIDQALQKDDVNQGFSFLIGTDEEVIFAALEGMDNGRRPKAQLDLIAREYEIITGKSLNKALSEDLSGEELERAMRLATPDISEGSKMIEL